MKRKVVFLVHESDLIYKVEIYSLYIGRKLKVESEMKESVLIYKVEVHFLYRCDKLNVEFEMEECVLIYRYRKMKVESEIEEVSLYRR